MSDRIGVEDVMEELNLGLGFGDVFGLAGFKVCRVGQVVDGVNVDGV